MKYYYNHFISLLIIAGSIIALEIIAARQYNGDTCMDVRTAGGISATCGQSGQSCDNNVVVHTTSVPATVDNVPIRDTKEEDWIHYKYSVKIIL